MVTMLIRDAQRQLTAQLASLESPVFEARQLLCGLLHVNSRDLLENRREVSEEEWQCLQTAAKRRLTGYPLQYLIGEWEFFGLPFAVGEGVLIPRADTEVLCEFALQWLKGKHSQRVLDLCSGSGCLAIAIAQESSADNTVYALEKSPQAISYLKRNLALNQSPAMLLEDDVLAPQTAETAFDLIVSNPPYLNAEDMEHLQTEVSFEPEMALFAEHDGFYFYERITAIWNERLNIGGMLAYEVGIHQAARVAAILEQNGFAAVRRICDLNGIERVVAGIKIR